LRSAATNSSFNPIRAQARQAHLHAALRKLAHDFDDFRVIADRGPDQPDLGHAGRDLLEITSFGTMRMPPLVERPHHAIRAATRATALALDQNMFDSSVCGVRIALYAGKSASLQAAILASAAPWCAGTKMFGCAAKRSSAAARFGAV